MELDERKRRILSAIVETYIHTGEPVGSKVLAETMGLQVSPATIRNEMATLFDYGLLEQPHTSSGRVPSHLGFRVYLDQLIHYQPLSADEQDEISALFNVMDPDPDKLLEDAAAFIAKQTGCAAFSTTFTPKSVKVQKVDLIQAGDRTVVILLIASNGVIKNKVCRVDFSLTPELIAFFNKFANGRLNGVSLEEISSNYINSMAMSLGEFSRVFTPILAHIYELCKEVYEGQFYTCGESNLLTHEELDGFVYEMMKLLENREDVLNLIHDTRHGVTVTIGRESPRMELSGSSLILSRYDIGENNQGAIGLIGPVRIDYAKVIPHLAFFSEMLSKLLTDTFEDQ